MFQGTNDVVLSTGKCEYAHVYFEDMAILLIAADKDLKPTGMVSQVLKDVCTEVKCRKYALFPNENKYLCHSIQP